MIGDPYQELGVSRDATPEEIGKAFRRLAARWHPDRNPGDKDAEERFKRIADAYGILSDPRAREAFDRGGEERVRTETGFDGFGNLDEVFARFGDLFGGAARVSRRRWPGTIVEPFEALLRVDVFTALLGGTVDLQLPKGRVEMRIPAGTQPGQTFRLRGQGSPDGACDALLRVEIDLPRTLTPAQRRLLEQARDVG
jgi:DnaJ-class molecular chaperone